MHHIAGFAHSIGNPASRATRSADDGAEFAVHSWLDDSGRQPHHFAADSPENRLYLDYYMEMGMAPDDARRFYDMTNSVANNAAKWLTAQDMRTWIGQSEGPKATVTSAAEMTELVPAASIAYLDLSDRLP
jgi:hypothetical protein